MRSKYDLVIMSKKDLRGLSAVAPQRGGSTTQTDSQMRTGSVLGLPKLPQSNLSRYGKTNKLQELITKGTSRYDEDFYIDRIHKAH